MIMVIYYIIGIGCKDSDLYKVARLEDLKGGGELMTFSLPADTTLAQFGNYPLYRNDVGEWIMFTNLTNHQIVKFVHGKEPNYSSLVLIKNNSTGTLDAIIYTPGRYNIVLYDFIDSPIVDMEGKKVKIIVDYANSQFIFEKPPILSYDDYLHIFNKEGDNVATIHLNSAKRSGMLIYPVFHVYHGTVTLN